MTSAPGPAHRGGRPVAVVGAVLAGGASRRMGRSKALLMVDGTPLARRVGDALVAGGADPVALVGGDPAWADAVGLAAVPDRWPGEGPLTGLATALTWARGLGDGTEADERVVVVAACDQVAVDGATIGRLVTGLVGSRPRAGGPVVGAVPVTPDGQWHPFPSAWRASAASAVAGLVEAGERRAGAASAVGVAPVPVDPWVLTDLDTPEDVDRWVGSPPHRPVHPAP